MTSYVCNGLKLFWQGEYGSLIVHKNVKKKMKIKNLITGALYIGAMGGWHYFVINLLNLTFLSGFRRSRVVLQAINFTGYHLIWRTLTVYSQPDLYVQMYT